MARLLMKIEYAKCRSMYRHKWEDFIPGPESGRRLKNVWGTRFYLRCERCATERTDIIDARGELAGRYYDYPKDYKYAADDLPELTKLRLFVVQDKKAHAKGRANGAKKATPRVGHRAPARTAGRKHATKRRARA